MKRFLTIAFSVLIGTILVTGTVVQMQLTVIKNHQLESK